MYAIVNIAGQQYKVEKDQKLFVHRLVEKEGETVNFEEVLLIDNDKSVVVGEPTIKGAMISGKVISHPRGDKIKVFKKKRRKGYKVRTGHRQYLTEIQIGDIIEKSAVKETKAKTTTKVPADTKAIPDAKKSIATAASKTEAVKTATAKEEKPAGTAATPKTVTKKPAAKTGTAKTAATKATTARPAAKKPEAKTAAKKPVAKTGTAKTAATKATTAKPAAKKPAAKKPAAGKETKE